jgi:hypothetical protein
MGTRIFLRANSLWLFYHWTVVVKSIRAAVRRGPNAFDSGRTMITPRPSLGRLTVALLLTIIVLSGLDAAAATLELSGPSGTVVSLNGRVLGTFPLDGPLDLPPGSYTIRCRRQGHVPCEQTVRLITVSDWQHLTVRLAPYSRRTALGSNLLLAGMGQHYLGNGLRGYVYNAAEVGGLLTALAGELQRSNLKGDYLRLNELYNGAINAEDVLAYRADRDAKYSDMQDMERLRDTGLLIAGGAVVVSIIDALLSFPALEAGAGPVPVDTGVRATPRADTETQPALHAGVRVSF